ncbi:hypothetical protein Ahy_B10g100611 isoform A [Arachis hypogaea]|uniref:RING-CH-type domain-containing protein n=1 Tax=Arachis hypogaea TaxID=3818 RepID=A0A444WX40_ARAHY|nr:hypothetical protein Ahy_B10g100611 isoform A [Arachis hypogaea]
MDQAASEGIGEVMDPVHERVDDNLSHEPDGAAVDAVGRGSLGERVTISGEVGTSEQKGKDLGSDKELKVEPEEVESGKKCDHQKNSDTMSEVDQGTSYNSSNLVNQQVVETVVVIEPVQSECVNGDSMKLELKVNESGLSKVSVRAPKGVSEMTDKNSCVIDIRCTNHKRFSESSEGERICRICHLASGRSSDATAVGTANGATSTDLIQLGCSCKDELGIAHVHCAEAWFKLKGNRLCEICGETAKNVSGVADAGFMEEWNEGRFMDHDNSSRRFGGCWRGQPFCNFLMACLVIAFVLPWFFRNYYECNNQND